MQNPTPRLPAALSRGPLTLRLWEPDDVPGLMRGIAANLEWLRPWMPWIREEPLSAQRRLELVQRWQRDFAAGMDATYGIFLDGQPVGGTGLHQRLGPGGLEIGYWVAQDVARRRVALTTAALLTRAGLEADGTDRVEIHHAVENVRSAGVPAALGYTRIGTFTDVPLADGLSGAQVIWRITREALTPELQERLESVAVRPRLAPDSGRTR